MRFSSRPPADYPPVSSGVRRRLWALVALLGAVGWMMQQLQQPETVERLGRAFQLTPPAREARDAGAPALHDAFVPGPLAQPPPAPADASGAAAAERAPAAPASGATRDDGRDAAPPPAADRTAAWDAVTDNAYFLPQEQAAWWSLWERALASRDGPASPSAWPTSALPTSLGEVSYVQLLQQPEAYRGQLVTVRGTAIRCEATRPAANALGLERLDRVWLAPAGGGEWPIVVYVADLEPEFPRGAAIRVPLTVDGYFFKVWSYAYDGGLGLAPALVAARWKWEPSALRARRGLRSQPLAWGWLFGGALALAGGAVAWCVWATRRPRVRYPLASPDAGVWSQLDHAAAAGLAPPDDQASPDAKPQPGGVPR